MAEEKSSDATMLCVSYAESVAEDEAKPDDVSFITLGQLPIPEIGDDDVLLAVKTSSINPVDYKLAHDKSMGEFFKLTYPAIIGVDVAGVVEKVGKNVEAWKVGDEVWGFPGAFINGGWAEKCRVPASQLARKPKAFSWETCGVLGCAAVTSMTAVQKANFQAGQNALVRGASGGTGLILVQLLKQLGAGGITAVCSGKNEGLVKEYGATEVIDYTKGDVATLLSDGGVRFDAFFDFAPGGTGGRELYKQVPGFVKKGGVTCEITEFGLEAEALPDHPVATVLGTPTPEVMAALSEVFENKPFRVEIMETFALKDWEQAFRMSKGHRVRGKICIKIAA